MIFTCCVRSKVTENDGDEAPWTRNGTNEPPTSSTNSPTESTSHHSTPEHSPKYSPGQKFTRDLKKVESSIRDSSSSGGSVSSSSSSRCLDLSGIKLERPTPQPPHEEPHVRDLEPHTPVMSPEELAAELRRETSPTRRPVSVDTEPDEIYINTDAPALPERSLSMQRGTKPEDGDSSGEDYETIDPEGQRPHGSGQWSHGRGQRSTDSRHESGELYLNMAQGSITKKDGMSKRQDYPSVSSDKSFKGKASVQTPDIYENSDSIGKTRLANRGHERLDYTSDLANSDRVIKKVHTDPKEFEASRSGHSPLSYKQTGGSSQHVHSVAGSNSESHRVTQPEHRSHGNTTNMHKCSSTKEHVSKDVCYQNLDTPPQRCRSTPSKTGYYNMPDTVSSGQDRTYQNVVNGQGAGTKKPSQPKGPLSQLMLDSFVPCSSSDKNAQNTKGDLPKYQNVKEEASLRLQNVPALLARNGSSSSLVKQQYYMNVKDK